MESANLQEFFVGYSSLVSAPTTASITHDSTPNVIFDGNSYNPYLEDQNIPCSRENIENQWFNFSSNYQTNEQQLPSLYSSIKSPPNYGGFQAIEAGSINTNGYNNHVFSSTNSRSCGTNSTLDLLSSSSFSSSMGFNLQDHHHQHHLDFLSATDYADGFLRNNALFGYGHQQNMQHSINYSPSNSSNKASTVTRAKRPVNSFSEPKKSNSETKKSCSISRSSCPPLKIRKEKLGDRISALQRLVAPFGKTDTSSVLTEAIGYIQFLHDQVETLSMPYLKSSQRKPYQKLQSGSIQEDETRPRQDLTSRGLCLVPLSCISFIHGCD